MDLVGKCPPDSESLEAAASRGFDRVELYLTAADLEDVAATAETVERSPVEAATVHTPHAVPEDAEPFRRADELARALDAVLVVHTKYAQHTHTDLLASHGFEAPHAFENNPGAGVFHLRNLLFEAGHDLVLDTAHLYTAEASYLDALAELVTTYGDRIPVVHLNDATRTTDGLAVGDGEMDLAATTRVLDRSFEGIVVLEVMPEDQWAAKQAVEGWLS